jgi:predicted lipid-binding transport protein (Tim44 family)
MKKSIALLAVVLTLGMTAAHDAEARRLGGARSSGMQRQNTTAPPATPAQGAAGTPSQAPAAAPAAGTAAAAAPGAAAAVPKRSWAGPLTGLAAGLGLAALASYLGFGEALANIMLIALAAMAVMVVIGLVMRRRAGGAGARPGLAGAGAGAGSVAGGGMFRHAEPSSTGSMIGSRLAGGTVSAAGAQAAPLPADFDAPAFVRQAKSQFLALQQANDARDLNRLRTYLTPEMFEPVQADLADRGDAPQATEVFGLEAQVLEVAQEGDQHVVSVRFTGSIRDQHGAVPEDLDEVWHLSKPRSGSGGWVIAGIQQVTR